jgi:hypothetical protein
VFTKLLRVLIGLIILLVILDRLGDVILDNFWGALINPPFDASKQMENQPK